MRNYRGLIRRNLATYKGTPTGTPQASKPTPNASHAHAITLAHIKALSPSATSPHVWIARKWHRHTDESVKVLGMYYTYCYQYRKETGGTPKALKEWRRQVHKDMPYFTPHLLKQVTELLDARRKK